MKEKVIKDEMAFFTSILSQCTEENRDRVAEIKEKSYGSKIFKIDDFYVIQGNGYKGENIISIQYDSRPFSPSIPRIEYRYDIEEPTRSDKFMASYRIHSSWTDYMYFFNGTDGIEPRGETASQISEFFEENPEATILECVETLGTKNVPLFHYDIMGKLSDLINLRKGEPQKEEDKSKFISKVLSTKYSEEINESLYGIKRIKELLQNFPETEEKNNIINQINALEIEIKEAIQIIEQNIKEDEEKEINEQAYERTTCAKFLDITRDFDTRIADIYKSYKELKDKTENKKLNEVTESGLESQSVDKEDAKISTTDIGKRTKDADTKDKSKVTGIFGKWKELMKGKNNDR